MSRTVIVIGGGASGLAAAIAAAEQSAAVTVLERLPRVGKKILLTGNGRCNLGHAGFSRIHYHGTLPQAHAILERFDTAAYFRRFGLYTRTDSEGRMYPMSGTAASVLDALRFAAAQRGVKTVCDVLVTDVQASGKRWTVSAGGQTFSADAVIFAAGGAAAPNCGTDGSLYPLLKQMGYTVIPPKPALCPVPTEPGMVRPLKGLRVRADVSAVTGERILKTESGELQFTENALSGICVFNLSRLTAMHGSRTELSVDFLPDFDADATQSLIMELISQRGDLPAGDLLTGLLPKRIGEQLLKESGGSCNQPASQISTNTRKKLCALLHDRRYPVLGQASFAQAQVTAGGIAGQCVTKQLASKLHKGLYFCGELLDLDGDCGGYNLTWSWASGVTAGSAAGGGTI